jgi:hypothetical protein
MSILTDYTEKKLLDHIFGQAAFTRSNELYLGLSTTAFADSDNGSTAAAKEPSGSSYARVRIDNISEYNTSGDDIRNSSSIDFAEATGSWGSIGYWGVFDGTGSSANMLMHGSFSSATTVASGDQFRISTGDFEINFPSAIYAADSNATYSQWRKQIGYRLGFDILGASPNADEEFRYYTDSSTQHDKLWLAVKTSAFPTSGLGGAEISGNNYARVKILDADDSSVDFFNAATTTSGTTTLTNDVAISFPEATGSWGNISHFAVFRSSLGQYGNTYPDSKYPIISGALTSTKTVNSGDRLRFGIGDLVITAS